MNEYARALTNLIHAVDVHRTIYNEREHGLASWHESCERSWQKLQSAWQKVRDLQKASVVTK